MPGASTGDPVPTVGGLGTCGTIARRLLQLVVVVVLSTLFAFSLLRLFPGDVADAVLPLGTHGAEGSSSGEDNGLDKPFFEQYATWLGNLVQGDLGKDYQSNTAGEPTS